MCYLWWRWGIIVTKHYIIMFLSLLENYAKTYPSSNIWNTGLEKRGHLCGRPQKYLDNGQSNIVAEFRSRLTSSIHHRQNSQNCSYLNCFVLVTKAHREKNTSETIMIPIFNSLLSNKNKICPNANIHIPTTKFFMPLL